MGTRLIGKLLFAAGFVLAVYGLGEAHPRAVNAGLALLVTGIAAAAINLYQHAKARRADRQRPEGK
jgi:4-hydroxybenzoate polyprenyltransferase